MKEFSTGKCVVQLVPRRGDLRDGGRQSYDRSCRLSPPKRRQAPEAWWLDKYALKGLLGSRSQLQHDEGKATEPLGDSRLEGPPHAVPDFNQEPARMASFCPRPRLSCAPFPTTDERRGAFRGGCGAQEDRPRLPARGKSPLAAAKTARRHSLTSEASNRCSAGRRGGFCRGEGQGGMVASGHPHEGERAASAMGMAARLPLLALQSRTGAFRASFLHGRWKGMRGWKRARGPWG
jgi:hypothetical protein